MKYLGNTLDNLRKFLRMCERKNEKGNLISQLEFIKFTFSGSLITSHVSLRVFLLRAKSLNLKKLIISLLKILNQFSSCDEVLATLKPRLWFDNLNSYKCLFVEIIKVRSIR